MTAQEYQAPASVGRLQTRALIVGVIGLIVSVVGFFLQPEKLLQSYLMAYLFVLGVTLGSLGLVMLQHLTGGHWGIIIRRPAESAMRTLPLLIVLFLPIVFGMKYLYGVWLHPSGEHALSNFQVHYLTRTGFILRAVLYFVIWSLLVFALTRWSHRQDVDKHDRLLRRHLKLISGPGIILYVVGFTFAVIDWVMSLTPHWFSTIYGFIYVAGQVISSLSLLIAVLVLLAQTAPMQGLIQKRHIHDISKLLLSFLMLWAYFAFSQLLIIWSGNLPDEITFYRSRLYGGWGYVAVIILIFHFFVPFFLLLSRDLKRNYRLITIVAVWLIFMRVVDLFWMTRAEFTTVAWPSVWDFATVLGLGGVWLAFFSNRLRQRPLLPLGEPKLAEAIGNNEH